MNSKQFSEDTYKTLLFLIEHPEFKDKIGTALIQRTFKIGYGRAANVIDELCECKLIERTAPPPSYYTLCVSMDELRKIMESQSGGLTMIERIESYKGKVLPVVARPGMGQESVALQIAIDYHARYGKTVLIINPVEEERYVRARMYV
jgi:DNA segregation ATPase FtsK/SpoIIIE-like protein